MSRQLNTDRTFATFRQKGLQFRYAKQISKLLGLKNMLRVKKTIDWHVEGKIKQSESKKYAIEYRGMSRLTANCVKSCYSKFHRMDKKQHF